MNIPIDASRSTGIIPPGSNGSHERSELPIEEAIGELANDDTVSVSRAPRKRTMKDELEELKRGKEEAERLLKEKERELVEVAKTINSGKPDFNAEEDGPYEGWDPTDPDPSFQYTGRLYRIDTNNIHTPIGNIVNFDFSRIALHYGTGTYMIRLGGSDGDSFRVKISGEFLREAIKNNKDLWREIQKEKEEAESLLSSKDPAPKETEKNNPMLDMFKAQAEKSTNLLETILLEKAKNGGGASSTEVLAARDAGYAAGKDSQEPLIQTLKARITDLESERDELKDEIRDLQIELGQKPAPKDEREEEEEKPEPSPIDKLMDLANKFFDYASKNKEIPQKLIEEKKEVVKTIIMNSDQLKKIILQLFAKKTPITEAAIVVNDAINLFSTIERGFISTALAENPAEKVVELMVKYFIPDASPAIQDYIKQIVTHIKSKG